MRFRHLETECIFMDNERLKRENTELKLTLEGKELSDSNQDEFYTQISQSVSDGLSDRSEIHSLLQLQIQAFESGE